MLINVIKQNVYAVSEIMSSSDIAFTSSGRTSIELAHLQMLLFENRTLNPIAGDLKEMDLEKQLAENLNNNPNLTFIKQQIEI